MRKILALIGVLVLPCVSLAQNDSAWSNLTRLQPGQQLQIVDATSKKHSGTFVSASDTAISYRETAGEHSIEKQDVRSVKLMENNHRLRNTLIFTGVGAGAGAGIGAAATGHGGSIITSVSHAKGAGVGAALGAVAGVTVGALLPSHSTIYSVGLH